MGVGSRRGDDGRNSLTGKRGVQMAEQVPGEAVTLPSDGGANGADTGESEVFNLSEDVDVVTEVVGWLG